MPTTHDYYAILEVETTADVALIKSQYRKLVRLNHPDISPDKDAAHARMQLILEAYTVLSDGEKREAYDRSRQNRSARTPASNSAASRSTPRPMPRQTPGGMGRPYGGGSAPSAYGGRGATRPGRPPGREMTAGATNTRARLLTMVFDAANLYFEDGRAPEAIAICERVMKADASNAEAPALLGDIYADKGRNDLALLNYERAVRLQPNNLLYRQKFEAAKQPNSQASASGKGKSKAKGGGCGGKAALWIFVIVTAATPFLIFYFGGP